MLLLLFSIYQLHGDSILLLLSSILKSSSTESVSSMAMLSIASKDKPDIVLLLLLLVRLSAYIPFEIIDKLLLLFFDYD